MNKTKKRKHRKLKRLQQRARVRAKKTRQMLEFTSETHVRCPVCYLTEKVKYNNKYHCYSLQRCSFCLYEFKVETKQQQRETIIKLTHDALVDSVILTFTEHIKGFEIITIYLSPPLIQPTESEVTD